MTFLASLRRLAFARAMALPLLFVLGVFADASAEDMDLPSFNGSSAQVRSLRRTAVDATVAGPILRTCGLKKVCVAKFNAIGFEQQFMTLSCPQDYDAYRNGLANPGQYPTVQPQRIDHLGWKTSGKVEWKRADRGSHMNEIDLVLTNPSSAARSDSVKRLVIWFTCTPA